MKPIYAFYGDDFTGSTDVLEQLAEGGVPAVLFLRPPDAALRARFSDARAIGLAGDSRSRPPAWMDENLPQAFSMLMDADIIHYKTCSTFDSSPETGSIGRAMEIGLRTIGGKAAIVVAAPHLRRYVVFGNLFAACGRDIYRIDRHPTMSCHPVTPMREADLVRHLAAQTDLRVALVSIESFVTGQESAAFEAAKAEADAVMFDGLSMEHLQATGRALLSGGIRFAAGSSGVTRALVLAWRKAGLLPEQPVAQRSNAGPVDRLLVVSGSCSPVTSRQIKYAAKAAYATIRADVAALLRGEASEERRLIEDATLALADNGRCAIYSADGPLENLARIAGDRLGAALGRVADEVIRRARLKRVVFAGGDTSSHGVTQLGIDALTLAAPIEPGVPLVRASASDPVIDGLELALKGGQMGGDDFFETVRRGGAPESIPQGVKVLSS